MQSFMRGNKMTKWQQMNDRQIYLENSLRSQKKDLRPGVTQKNLFFFKKSVTSKMILRLSLKILQNYGKKFIPHILTHFFCGKRTPQCGAYRELKPRKSALLWKLCLNRWPGKSGLQFLKKEMFPHTHTNVLSF